MQAIQERFVELGREDALLLDPTTEVNDELLWRRAREVVHSQLRRKDVGEQDLAAAQAVACGAYVEGWMYSYRLMTTVPHLRIMSQVWTIGYRSPEDRERLVSLFQPGDEQAACRLLVDIRYRPAWPYHPEWSRKQLRARYHHQYRYLRALGNKHYNDRDLLPELVDEQAGLACLIRWLQDGWDLILLCACADAATCHRRLVAQRLQQTAGSDPRIQVHVPGRADT